MTADLTVELGGPKGGLTLRTPVMTAAGVFGYGSDYRDLVDTAVLGAIVCAGTTLRPRRGERPPRMTEATGGILMANGHANIGVRAVVEERAPVWAAGDLPVIVSIAGETVDEFAAVAARLEGVEGVAAVEVDIGSATYAQLAERFGADPSAAAEVTAAVREATGLPLLVKLPILSGTTARVAAAVEAAGADALTVGGAPAGMAIDVRRRRPVLAAGAGGLSGPAIKPLGLFQVFELWGQVGIPIIGCGGIASAHDALEYLLAGAAAVQIGMALFVDPRTPDRIVDGIRSFLVQQGHDRVQEIVGAAHH